MDKIIPFISNLGPNLSTIILVIFVVVIITTFVVKTNIALKDIPEIKEKINFLYAIAISSGAVFKKNSPAELTRIGEDIIKEIDAISMVDKNIDALKKLVNNNPPKSAYSLQEKCFSVVNSNMKNILNDTELKIIKEQSAKYGFTIEKTLPIFAILLRDRLLKEKGWDIADIDK